MDAIVQQVYGYIVQYGMNVLAAIVIFVVGRWVADVVAKLAEQAMLKANVDRTLASFTRHLGYYGIMTFVVVAALNKLGVETTSFIAVIGAASLAVGLALQGSLANFASGVMLILFQPFHVGEKVEAAGTTGIVHEIQIFNTILITDDNKKVIIPNAKITGDKVVVYPKA
jgi:small conductance mechanosensitive channel